MKSVAFGAIAITAGCGQYPPADTGSSAYVIIPARSVDQGWTIANALDTELTPGNRRQIKSRGQPNGTSTIIVVEFRGTCAGGATFVAEVGRAARKRGVSGVVCDTKFPSG